MDGAAGEDGGGVEDVLGPLGKADDGDDPLRPGREPVERRPRVGQKVLLEQQVLGRVARQGQLGEQCQLGSGGAGLRETVLDQPGVARDVTDGGVDLAQGEAYRPIVCAQLALAGFRELEPAAGELARAARLAFLATARLLVGLSPAAR